jgi:hypothetical protein
MQAWTFKTKITPVISGYEIGEACSTYRGAEKVYTVFWLGNLRESDHLEDQGVDGRKILR